MAAVPETTLNWLYSVLTSNYTEVNRTYHDAAEALSHYPSLAVHTEVYTYENGTSSLLVRLRGTLPVTFRGATYGFPVAVWLPYAYPREPPIVYVQPEKDMLVRPGQHVSGDGRVYHPYLAQWARYWDKSTVYDFLAVLRGVFAKEPPVRSRVQVRPPQQVPQQQAPPPVPPPPAELRREYAPSPAREPAAAPQPPPKPPKPYEQEQGRYSQPPPPPKPLEPQDRYSQPPPLPPQPRNYAAPPPHQAGYSTPPPAHWQQPPHQQQQQQQHHSTPPRPHVQPQAFQQSQYGVGSPVSPLTPQDQRAAPRHAPAAMPQYQVTYQQQQQPQQQQYNPQQPPPHQQPPQQQQYQQQPYQPPHQPPQQYAHHHAQPPAPQPPPNLLDDTLTSTTTHPPPAPPIPPNPEKDALLALLSSSLVTHIRSTVSTNTRALAPLLAQQAALQTAFSRLQSELAELRALDAALESNAAVLGSAMRDADGVIGAAAHRSAPDVDDVLVAPTVVGGQLYGVAAEERGIADALFVLGRALDKGRIGVDVFVRQSRVLAREAFLKKALLRKIARGMGIDEVGMR